MNPKTASIRRDLFVRFFDVLDATGIDYVVVGRTSDFPENISSDVDFVVRPADLARVVDIVWQWQDMARLHQVLQHEIGAFYFVLTARSGDDFIHFHPDVSTNYRRRQRCWLTADFLLCERVKDPAGFWKPASPAAFAYYLVKRIDKLALDEAHLQYLKSLFQAAPHECAETGRRLLGKAAWDEFSSYLSQVQALPHTFLTELQIALVAHALREPTGRMLRNRWLELRRRMRRVLRPSGLVIAVLGPDGSGKSTLIEGIRRELGQLFRRTDYIHLRPRFLRQGGVGILPTTDPHRLPPRGTIASLAKLVMYVTDSWLGHALRVFPLKRHSSLVIFDRYPHDMLADPKRYRLSTPRWINALLLKPVPLPDMWLVLDAPAAVLLGRKAEVSAAACEEQLVGYRRLLQNFQNAVGIDAAKSSQSAIADACEAVLIHMRERLVKPVL